MTKKKESTVGYKYFASGHFVLCHGPIDSITKISFQDRDAYLNEESENKTITINKNSLFGGDEQSGGVKGDIELLFGRHDQQKSSTLQRICGKISDAFGGLISAYRGVTSIVFDNVYIGTSPNMPDSKWRVKRIHTRHDGIKQWYDEKAEIGYYYEYIESPEYIYKNHITCGVLGSVFTEKGQQQAIDLDFTYTSIFDSSDIRNVGWSIGGNDSSVADHGDIDGKILYIIPKTGVVSKIVFEVNTATLAQDTAYDVIGVLAKPLEINNNYPVTQITAYFVIPMPDLDPSPVVVGIKAHASGGVREDGGARIGVMIKARLYECWQMTSYFYSGAGDINPAHIIRECLTNKILGIGVAESNVDDVSFIKAADRLYFERMGMSIKWTDSTSINEFVDNIKEHINAQLYLDRITNKWKLYLIRDDYDVSDLISLDESNIRNLDFERRTLAECVNSVTVTYWDRERGKDSTVTVQDIARIAQQGGVISQSIDYKGFTNSDLASRVALRDLKTLSSTLASVSFDVDESFSENWHEGMPFKLSDASYGLSEAVMRIRTIKRGDGINNTVYVEAIEDSFSSPMQSVVEYVPQITSGDSAAKDATTIAFEVPYVEVVEQYGQDEVDAKLLNYPDLGYVGMAAIRPNNQHINANLYVNSGAGYDERTSLDFCPSATLKTAISYMDSSFELENVAEFDLLEVNHRIQLNNEIMAFVSFNAVTNVITVKRGCFDTVPKKHGATSKIFGWDNYSGIDDIEYLSGEVISLKALTMTSSDALELGGATARSLTLLSRAIRPYPPANVQINNVLWPETLLISSDLVVSWVHRNRIQQTGGIPLGFYDAGIATELGVTYSLELSTLQDGVLLSASTINADNYVIPQATILPNKVHRLKLWSVRDNYDSYQIYEHSFFAEAASLILTAMTNGEKAAGNTVPTANINVKVDTSLKANMQFDGSKITGKTSANSVITIEIEE